MLYDIGAKKVNTKIAERNDKKENWWKEHGKDMLYHGPESKYFVSISLPSSEIDLDVLQ